VQQIIYHKNDKFKDNITSKNTHTFSLITARTSEENTVGFLSNLTTY